MAQKNRVLSHLSGITQFTDDIPSPPDTLLGFRLGCPCAHARIISIDVEEARGVEGVEAVLTASDIPGINDMSVNPGDEPVLASDEVEFYDQTVVLIAARDAQSAARAMAAVKIRYEELEPVLDVDTSFQRKMFSFEPLRLRCGDAQSALSKADIVIEDSMEIGGQEHFYIETQGALCMIRDDGSFYVRASTQSPSDTQKKVANALGISINMVEVETYCLGGAFGGKETQGNWCAIWSSLLANATNRPVKIVLSRTEDMAITGKRHPVKALYKAGFDASGKIVAFSCDYLFNIGFSSDVSYSIMERCLYHAENAYFIDNMDINLYPCRTNFPSNTAFRGFGAPQGIAVIEQVMERAAHRFGKDPMALRRLNYYGLKYRNITPYGQKVESVMLRRLHDKILKSSDYVSRRREINEYNRNHQYTKRGLAGVPVKFGISFTATFLNQGAALLNFYTDGSLIIHQGGVEMGQGLYDKMVILAASAFGIKESKVKICRTQSAIIPNTSSTAASSGSDLNGQAVLKAVAGLKKRLGVVAAGMLSCSAEHLVWKDENVEDSVSHRFVSLRQLLEEAYLKRVNLSEKAFYATPYVYKDPETLCGRPFLYYTCGLAITEVELDVLSGGWKMLRADILHDTGHSINADIDRGQVEGAFIQACGWCTMEELHYNDLGRNLTASPDTYKIPGIADIPEVFNVELFEGNPYPDNVNGSRAIGEPPFCYGLSLHLALCDAIRAVRKDVDALGLPITKDIILSLLPL